MEIYASDSPVLDIGQNSRRSQTSPLSLFDASDRGKFVAACEEIAELRKILNKYKSTVDSLNTQLLDQEESHKNEVAKFERELKELRAVAVPNRVESRPESISVVPNAVVAKLNETFAVEEGMEMIRIISTNQIEQQPVLTGPLAELRTVRLRKVSTVAASVPRTLSQAVLPKAVQPKANPHSGRPLPKPKVEVQKAPLSNVAKEPVKASALAFSPQDLVSRKLALKSIATVDASGDELERNNPLMWQLMKNVQARTSVMKREEEQKEGEDDAWIDE